MLLPFISKHPTDSTAVVFRNITITYGQLHQRVQTLAKQLIKQGLRQGDVVSSFLPNSLENLYLTLACFQLGLVSVPIRSNLVSDSVTHILNDATPKLVVTDASLSSELTAALTKAKLDTPPSCFVIEDEAERGQSASAAFSQLLEPCDATLPADISDFDIPATILYTSGSTGAPKGAVHTQAQWLYNTRISARKFSPTDVTYLVLSMNHAYAFGEQVLPALYAGATLFLHDHFDFEAFLTCIQSGMKVNSLTFKATSFYGVPNLYRQISERVEQPIRHSLTYMGVAGDILSTQIKSKIRLNFGDVLRPSYGMTEAMCIAETSEHSTGATGVLGQPREGLDYIIINADGKDVADGEAGELCIKSPSVCKYYHNSTQREKDTVRGYFRTGDFVKVCDGDLVFINRLKRIIVTQDAYKINPTDIEEVITAHDGVTGCCAFDIEDLHSQLLIVALVSCIDSDISPDMLFHLFDSVESLHRPNVISIIDKFEFGTTGKINWRFHKEQTQEKVNGGERLAARMHSQTS